jgi:hypothetical protein
MLKFKNFKLTNDVGINDLLSKNILAKGASVYMSNGEILIPYEDGSLPSPIHQILFNKELRNEQVRQLDILIHSQKVNDAQATGIRAEISKLEEQLVTTPKGKEEMKKNREISDEVRRLTNVLNQTETQIIMNQAEVTRLVTNINVFEESIATLESNVSNASFTGSKDTVSGEVEAKDKKEE